MGIRHLSLVHFRLLFNHFTSNSNQTRDQRASSPLAVSDGGEIVSRPGNHLNTDTAQVCVAWGTPATSSSSSFTTLSRVGSLAGDSGTETTEKPTLDPALALAWSACTGSFAVSQGIIAAVV